MVKPRWLTASFHGLFCSWAGADRNSVRRLAVELDLLREEAPNMIGLDCRDVDDAIAEAGIQQSPHDAQSNVPGLGCQTKHIVHVLVVTESFLIPRALLSVGGSTTSWARNTTSR